MDHHGNSIENSSLSTQSIEQLIYSCDKFYPDALDNSTIHIIHSILFSFLFSSDAPKFVNDDYILACSLKNGQVLLLTNYHDQSPITIDTNLQSKIGNDRGFSS